MALEIFKPLHISWHIAVLAVGVITGTALALITPANAFIGSHWPLIAAAVLFLVVIKRLKFFLLLALVSGLLLGLWRGSTLLVDLSGYGQFYGQNVRLQAKVVDDAVRRDTGELRLNLGKVSIEQVDLPGEVWISTTFDADIKRGDVVVVAGRLDEGFGSFSAAMFRAELLTAQRPEPGDVGRRLRDWFAGNIAKVIPQPQDSLGVSYLFGQRRALQEDISEQMRILGLTHLVVASGFHLTILVRAARRAFVGVSKYLSLISSGGMIGLFLLITNFSTSMTRASLVAGLSLAAWYYGRHIHPLVLLLVVAALTVIYNPVNLWGDIGWYLSFSAFAGVIILAPLLNAYFWGVNDKPGFFRHLIIATTAAQITTFPVIAYVFGHYSPLALVSNLLIMPLVPVAMGLVFIAGLSNILLGSAAELIGLPAYWLLLYMTTLTERLSITTLAQGQIEFGIVSLVVGYLLVVLLMSYLYKATGLNLRQQNPIH